VIAVVLSSRPQAAGGVTRRRPRLLDRRAELAQFGRHCGDAVGLLTRQLATLRMVLVPSAKSAATAAVIAASG